LPPAADGATLLQNFACFSNLTSPSTSEVVVCPSNNPGCRRSPHPGQNVFRGADDLNYQRLLAFIYGSKANVSPLDYAFFVRRINPIFNDINAVEGGAQNRTCADGACHGISVAGQAAPNGSDFPILSNASGDARLSFNFVSATGFVNFLNPGESSLFLYPTNEIANRADHPFATGLPHPGGTDFATDSAEALAIRQWAAGLRPDAGGFQRNWLVLGDFAASQISDPTLVNEATTIPKIFDPGGGSFNRGQWDGLFADASEVDLNVAFPRAASSGRAAYAVSYVLNTVPRDQVVQIAVATTNPVRIYVNGLLVAQNDQGGGTTALTTLTGSGAGRSARIMIKLLQRATDTRFAFTAQLRDEQGILLTDRNGGLVFTLGPNGGI
jgi:acyl-coenzyme A thioesterase PaaI-like protein